MVATYQTSHMDDPPIMSVLREHHSMAGRTVALARGRKCKMVHVWLSRTSGEVAHSCIQLNGSRVTRKRRPWCCSGGCCPAATRFSRQSPLPWRGPWCGCAPSQDQRAAFFAPRRSAALRAVPVESRRPADKRTRCCAAVELLPAPLPPSSGHDPPPTLRSELDWHPIGIAMMRKQRGELHPARKQPRHEFETT